MSAPKAIPSTRFVIECEDMDDTDAVLLAKLLQETIGYQTDHQILRLLYQRGVPFDPNLFVRAVGND